MQDKAQSILYNCKSQFKIRELDKNNDFSTKVYYWDPEIWIQSQDMLGLQ